MMDVENLDGMRNKKRKRRKGERYQGEEEE